MGKDPMEAIVWTLMAGMIVYAFNSQWQIVQTNTVVGLVILFASIVLTGLALWGFANLVNVRDLAPRV